MQINTLQQLVISMKKPLEEALANTIPLLERNNKLIEENNSLKVEVNRLQSKLIEENKFNDDKHRFYLQQMMRISEIELWMKEKTNSKLGDGPLALGKRVEQIHTDVEESRKKNVMTGKEKAKQSTKSIEKPPCMFNSQGWK
jgi:hypothetical protein